MFVCLVWALSAEGAQKHSRSPKTNLKALTAFLDSALVQIFTTDVLGRGDTITVAALSPDTSFSVYVRRWVENRLVAKWGCPVQAFSPVRNVRGKRLLFQWQDWKISYRPLRKWLGLRSAGWRRNISASAIVQVVDFASGNVVFSRQMNLGLKDVVRSPESVETRLLPFTRGVQEKHRTGFLGILEPVFLFAISGTVIYLFYAVRSQ